MAMINFKLKHPDDITPWGEEPNANMHWFALTDSEYWLDIGKAAIYESTPERILQEQFDSKYVDYFLVRLVEDLTGLFESIAEPLPGGYYAMAKTYQSFHDYRVKLQRWRDQITEEQYDDSLDDDHQLAEWFASRSLTSMHLAYGPDLSFFRNKDKLSIVWDAGHVTEVNTPIWTAKTGEIEILYDDFIKEIEDFKDRFFIAMDKQVEIALQKDWGTTQLDKKRLAEEHEERKQDLLKSISILKDPPTKQTDWDLTSKLIVDLLH